MYSLLLIALNTVVSKSSVICGIGVDWYDGDILIEDIVSHTANILVTTNKNLNSLTRAGTNGAFYTVGHQNYQIDSQFTLFKYDPCVSSELQTIGTGEIPGYDVRGLAYNTNDNLLYALFYSSSSSVDKLYTIDPNTASLNFIVDVRVHSQTSEFDDNGVLYAWSATDGLFSIDITTGDINQISTASQPALGPLQFIAFDPNDNNILYGGHKNVYNISKLTGVYTLTPFQAHSHRGFNLLDQDTCNQVQCDINQPTTSPTTVPTTTSPTLANISNPPVTSTKNPLHSTTVTDSSTTEATINTIILTESEISLAVQSEKSGIPIAIIIAMIIVFVFCVAICSVRCRAYHKKKINREGSSKPSIKHSMRTQIAMNDGAVTRVISATTPSPSPEPIDPECGRKPSQLEPNVIGVMQSIPLAATSQFTYNPMLSTYKSTADFNKLRVVRTMMSIDETNKNINL